MKPGSAGASRGDLPQDDGEHEKRLEEEWWTDSPTGRDYWDVELEGGGIYRLYRDRTNGEWWADGIYD